MSIWFKPFTIEEVQAWAVNNLIGHLGIRFTEIGPDYLRGTMPVDHRTHQIAGILHGGASVTLAETLGSTAANMCVDMRNQQCVGQEINANHLRAVSSGVVTGTTRPIHVGRRSQVWQTEIHDEQRRLICISRLTVAVIERDPRASALRS